MDGVTGLFLHPGHRDYAVARPQPLTGRGPGAGRWNALAQNYSLVPSG